MIKTFYISSAFGFFYLSLFLSGFFMGLQVRMSVSSDRNGSDPIGLECTCAICQPDRWCRKCGHKSRDCPKFSWYFKRLSSGSLTNRFSSVTNIVPIPLTFAPK